MHTLPLPEVQTQRISNPAPASKLQRPAFSVQPQPPHPLVTESLSFGTGLLIGRFGLNSEGWTREKEAVSGQLSAVSEIMRRWRGSLAREGARSMAAPYEFRIPNSRFRIPQHGPRLLNAER